MKLPNAKSSLEIRRYQRRQRVFVAKILGTPLANIETRHLMRQRYGRWSDIDISESRYST